MQHSRALRFAGALAGVVTASVTCVLFAPVASAQTPPAPPTAAAPPAAAAPAAATQVTTPPALDDATLAGFRWRQVGPANMGGRITDVAGIPSPSRTFYVSTAAGGVFKTTNAGTTFKAVIDTARVASGGMLAIAPSDSNTVYWGTGEPNSRNSMSPGGGVYKTIDGGKSWSFLGLAETRHIGRIQIHPKDPNTVWVAALGHAWGPNKERGLYKTTDGGKTWRLTKFINDRTGMVDVQLDPRDPNVVWAASYQRERGAYYLNSGGPGSALWKSTDGGETFTEVKGGGFPESVKGRISVVLAPSNPDIMYSMVEADTNANAKPADPKAKAQTKPSGLYRSADAGKTWTLMNPENTRPFYYSQVRVDPRDADRVYWSSTPVKYSSDGGKTAGNATVGIHVDHHAMWIDPADPAHMIVGDDGGVSQTWDRGGNWDFLNTIAIGQFYAVSFDMAVPYRVCGGLQDNGSWCGPSKRKNGPVTNAMWNNSGGGDGFVTAQDPTNPNIMYSESQGGAIGRYDLSVNERTGLTKPNYRDVYNAWEDSIVVARGDTTKPETPALKQRVAALRARQKADSLAMQLRWNWNTPYFISKHNTNTLYFGANRVLKSTKRGDEMYFISPDLSYADTMKIRVSTKTTGGITTDATGAETFGTVVSLNESPLRPGILYAGTDDGRVWSTKNDGGSWEELTGRFPGLPVGTYVSRIEPSHFDSSTVYITFDNHRRDDYTPYAYSTTDGGKTFKSLAATLPHGQVDFVHVIREDLKNPDLLFLGTDVGAYVSLDRGATWQRFMMGLPSTPVHDLQIHPRDNELIAATHGRSIWIVDINALQQMTPDVRAAKAVLFAPRIAHQWGEPPINGGDMGQKQFAAQSPQYGADITWRLTASTPPVRIIIQDVTGDTLRTLNGSGAAGFQRVLWDMRGKAPARKPLSPAGLRDSIRTAQRIETVLDSLEKLGTMPQQQITMIRTALRAGPAGIQQMMTQFAGFGGGGGRGGPVAFVERPGESAATASFGAGGRGGAPGGGRGGAPGGEGAAAAAPDINSFGGIFGALQSALGAEALGFGGGRGASLAPLVGTGDYLVTLVAGGATYKKLLHVERVSGGDGSSLGFGEEEDAEGHDGARPALPAARPATTAKRR